jgi:hypothetical protein
MAYGEFKEDDFLEGYNNFVQNQNEEMLLNLNLTDETVFKLNFMFRSYHINTVKMHQIT